MRKSSERENTFSLPSNRHLSHDMGEFNALCEYLFLAHRELMDKFRDSKYHETEFRSFLIERGTVNNIPLKDLTIKKPEVQILRLFLYIPLSAMDKFIEEFSTEVKCLINSDFTLGKDGSKFQKLIDGLANISIKINVPKLYTDIFDYYREIRNSCAHSSKEEDFSKAYNKIDRNEALKIMPKWRDILNGPDTLNLDDIALACAIVKRIADHIVTSLYQYISWNDVDFDKFGLTKELRKKLKQEQKNKNKDLDNFFRTNLGVGLTEYDLDELVGVLTA